MKTFRRTILIALFTCTAVTTYSEQQDLDSLLAMDLKQLMNLEVVSSAKIPNKLRETNGAIVSLSRKEIEETGSRILSYLLKRVMGIQFFNRRN